MRFRLLIAAAALLAVVGGPLFAQGPSSEKPPAPTKVGGKTLEQWVREIRHSDPGRRQTAIRAVPYFGKPAAKEALPALLDRLQYDTDTACRVHVALTLSNLAEHVPAEAAPEAVRLLIDRAHSDAQAIVRLHAVWALGSFGPKATAAIPILVKHIHDPISWELRQAVVTSLASVAADKKFGPDPQAVAAIARLLSTGDEKSSQVRLAAVGALRVMGKPEPKEFALAKEALEKATRDPDKTVAVWAWVALMTLDEVTAERLSEVARYLKVKDTMLKMSAASALGALGREARPHIGDVADLLDDADPLVVATAIDVLGGFGPAAVKTVPALRKVMERKEHGDYFRQAAAAALKQITGVEEKAPAAGPPPRPGLAKPADPTEVGGKTLDQWIKEIKSNPDPSVQETAMRVVPYFGKKAGAAAPALVSRLRDPEHPDIACRAHAILALAAIADDVSDKDAIKAVEAITYTIKNESQVVLRYHAATALGAYSTRAVSAIPALLDRIHDPNSWELRQAAIASLSTIAGNDPKVAPDPRAVVALANRLLGDQERSGGVRMMAVMALGALGRPANPREFNLAVQALQKSLIDPDKSVEIWAAVALMAVDKITDKGLDEVAKHFKGKDVAAKITAARALGAMGKEARPKIGALATLLDDDDATVVATALDVLAGFGSPARDAVPAVKRFADKVDQKKDLSKEQREYFKEAAKYTIDQIEGARK